MSDEKTTTEIRQSRRLRIVMLDDHPQVFDILAAQIRQNWPTCEISTFEHGDPASDFIKLHPPDLLITDQNHPGASAKMLIELCTCPVLIISGLLDPKYIPQSFPSRVHFLCKPYTVAEFKAALRNLDLGTHDFAPESESKNGFARIAFGAGNVAQLVFGIVGVAASWFVIYLIVRAVLRLFRAH